MKDRHRPPVLVVGAHRSGTTATARALQLLGLQIGQRLDSHHEPYGLQRLHETYLHRVGAAWYEPEPFLDLLETSQGRQDCVNYLRQNIRQHFANIFGYRNDLRGFWLRARVKLGAQWGWKEPRTTLFAPAWLEIFPQARVVHVVRDPQAAAASIRQRELQFQAAGDAPSGKVRDLDYCRRLVLIYVAAVESLVPLANYRRIQFEEIQANPRNALEEIAQFCGLAFTNDELTNAAATIRPANHKSTSR